MLTQDIDVSSGSSVLSGGNVKFTLSAYLGSILLAGSTGGAEVEVAFKNASGQPFSTTALGPLGGHVSNEGADLSLQQKIGLVPAGTMRITVTLTMSIYPYFEGYGYGAADSLSLVFNTLGTFSGSMLGHNLVLNPAAEEGLGVPPPAATPNIPGWSTYGASVAPYGGTGWIGTADPGPADRGVNVFWGYGPTSLTGPGDMYQDIDVSAAASLIDSAQVSYQVSAWLGALNSGPTPTLTYAFFDWSGKQLAATGQLGSASPAGTSLVVVSHSDTLPAGTRRVHIDVSFPSGYPLADDISFILATPSGPPVIEAGGLVSAGAVGGSTSIAAGSWIEIYGTNQGTSTVGWTAADFNNGVGPTLLGGVRVSVGGQAAFVDYVSSGQVNALLPSNTLTGPMPVSVTNSNGTSDPYYVYVNQIQPSLLAPAQFNIGGLQYVAALSSDGQTFALPAGSVFGVTSAPARPGQTVVMYGIGFGPVSDGVTAGTIATRQDSLTTPLEVMFGSTRAQITYAGLVSMSTGLYQINVVVPQIPSSNAVPITLNLGTATGSQKLYIAVQN